MICPLCPLHKHVNSERHIWGGISIHEFVLLIIISIVLTVVLSIVFLQYSTMLTNFLHAVNYGTLKECPLRKKYILIYVIQTIAIW